MNATGPRDSDPLAAQTDLPPAAIPDGVLESTVVGSQSSELARVLDQYLAELQAGRQPDRERLLAEHPEIAEPLQNCLAGIEFIHRAAAAPAGTTPTRLGDFRIEREIGRGGMGVVYEAEQISLKRRVALKVLRFGAASDSEAMQRFQREAETVAGLHHTNIVPIFAIGCERGVNYYAMQFIEGRSLNVAVSLRETNAERPSAPSARSTSETHSTSTPRSAVVSRSETATEIANWGLQAAEALAHAHLRGVIHRDIKPSNLILDPDGRIWLTDFGLAKRMDDVSLSMAGAILGTPRYMSPEQAAASKNPVDHRTDIYSLGATLYELATGRPLFEADSPHLVITQILTSDPPAPRVVCPSLHRDFETIILKCLAKEPAQRYATAQALADDLRAFVEGRAIKARRSTLVEQAARWFKQQKRSVGIAAAAVAATVFVVIGSLIAWQMHGQAKLGYLTLNTPRDGNERAEVAEVLTLDDQPVGSPFTLPTKEPLALPEGAYRLRLTAPGKVSQTYLFDIAAGGQQTHEVGLVNETVGHAIPLRSPVGVEVVQRSRHAPRDEQRSRHAPRDEPNGPKTSNAGSTSNNSSTSNARSAHHAERDGYVNEIEPRLFVGPQDQTKPTLRCYSIASQPQQHTVQEGSSINVVRSTEPTPLWEADWRLEAPDVISFLKLPADREAWKVLPAQTDVFAWQQVLAWFDPSWFRNGSPPKVLQPARDLNGDGVEDVIWSAPQLANRQQGSFGPGPLTPKAAVLVAASGKDGKPLWWSRPQDSTGSASWLMTAPVWAGDDVLVCALRSTNGPEAWLEAVNAKSGESLWRSPVPQSSGTILPSLLNSAVIQVVSPTGSTPNSKPFVVAVVTRYLVAIDVATGQPLWEPLDLGESLQEPPRFSDLDGDGRPEVLSISMANGQPPQLTAISLTDRQPLWTAPVGLNSDSFQQRDPQHQWPEVVDLDGDGRAEVILPNGGGRSPEFWNGVQVLDGSTGKRLWARRFPQETGQWSNLKSATERYTAGPDLSGDGSRELVMVSVRRESQMHGVGQTAIYQRQHYFLYVDCFSGRDGQSVWWQRIPLGLSEYSTWTGTPETPIWWQSSRHAPRDEPFGTRDRALPGVSESQTTKAHHAERDGYVKLVLPVRRHADQGGDGIGNAGARLLFVLSATTGRVEHQAENLALPQLVDWNNDGLDDLAVFVPDDPQEFANAHNSPYKPIGKFVVLRGSPPEAFRRLDRWTEEQDFDGDGIAELSKRHDGSMGRMGDFAVLIASGRDGHLMSKWKTEWPETPHEFTVGDVQSFAPPLGDFDGDGLADLLISREQYNWDFERGPLVKTGQAPLLIQAISSKTGERIWGGVPLALPDWLRPKNADENSEDWMQQRNGRLHPVSTQAVDLDGDGRPEVLQSLRLTGYRRPEKVGDPFTEHQQPFVALIDARAGTLRWFEPISEIVVGDHAPGLDYLRIDASTDLNGDGTRDLVLTVPQQLQQGSWLQTVQVHSGRDGKILWGPKPLEGENFNNNDFNSPIISDLDGDGRPELVLMASKQPHVTVLRGDTGEQLWTWKGSQPQYFAAPGIAVVAQSSRHAPRDESRASTDADRAKDVQPTKNADSALGSPHAEREGYIGRRCVAIAFNETGSQWEIASLDHEGQLLERVPCGSNQLWSQDLDGDGGEELLRFVDTKLTASRGLHDVLWTWSRPASDYGFVSRFERTADGRAIVVTASVDSLTLLDGPTGKPLGRTFKSTNTSLHENGRLVDLNHANIATQFENSRLVTRVGDGPLALGHIVSRAVLPTDDDGRYQRSRHAPRDEPNAPTTTNAGSTSINNSTSTARSAHHAERDGYLGRNADDPRLVRQLMWAPTPAEWAARRGSHFNDVLLAVSLSLVVVLIPYWLIRAGVQRRDLGRWRIALIGGGLSLLMAWLTLLRFPPPGAMWRELPWALPFAMSVGGLPIVLYPVALLRAFASGDWCRIRWLVIATIVLSLLLGAIQMAVDLSHKPPEQHYSWFGWWMIFAMGAYFTGGCLVLGQAFGPVFRWIGNAARRRFARAV